MRPLVKKTKAKTFTYDITPTWTGILPHMLLVLEDGTEEGKEIIRENFERMAAAADIGVKYVRDKEKQTKLEVE